METMRNFGDFSANLVYKDSVICWVLRRYEI